MVTTSDDPSARYVLPPDAPYLANMATLWAHEPALAAMLEAVEPYPVEPSRSGPPTVAVTTADGRRAYLHSRVDPLQEAEGLTRDVEVEGKLAVYLFGMGLGYHLEKLFDRLGGESIFCVFEADPRILRTALEARDYSRLLKTRRLFFFTSLDKSDLLTRLTPQTALLSVGVCRVTHAASWQANPAFYEQFSRWLEEFESFGRTSMNTLVLNSRRTAENIARNIGWYAASKSISRLKSAYAGYPAIIVSAGPSLRKNKHLLKLAQGRAVIVAVQTTLQPMLEMGIEPQFVTSLDYHEICTRFFEKLPDSLRTEMIAEPKANHAILKMFPGRASILGNDFAEGLLREMNLRHEALPPGATVAHLAYYLAEHMACDPIIFVGQDLGFSDGLCYAPGTSYEDVWRPELSRFCTVEMKQWDQIVRERFILRRIPDAEGRPMYTEERLFAYLQQFERDFLATRTRIIDATEGGAAKRGTTPMRLADAIELHCGRPIPDLEQPGEMDWGNRDRVIQSLEARQREAEQIEKLAEQTLPLLEQIRDHIDDQPRVNRLIASIDALRAKMNQLGPCYDLISQLTQPTEFKRFEADRRLSVSKIEGLEKQRRQVERDIDNVSAIRQAAVDFASLMGEVVQQLIGSDASAELATPRKDAA